MPKYESHQSLPSSLRKKKTTIKVFIIILHEGYNLESDLQMQHYNVVFIPTQSEAYHQCI